MSEKKQTLIVRGEHENKFTVVDNFSVAQNRSLSYEARGLLLYLLSMPVDWQVRPTELEQEGARRDKISRMIGELVKSGHIFKEKIREGNGRFVGYLYTVYEYPLPETDLPETGLPETGLPHAVERPLQRTYLLDEPETKDENEDKENNTQNQKGVCFDVFGDSLKKMQLLYGDDRVHEVCCYAVKKNDPPAWAMSALKGKWDLKAKAVGKPVVERTMEEINQANDRVFWEMILVQHGLSKDEALNYMSQHPEDRFVIEQGDNPYENMTEGEVRAGLEVKNE